MNYFPQKIRFHVLSAWHNHRTAVLLLSFSVLSAVGAATLWAMAEYQINQITEVISELNAARKSQGALPVIERDQVPGQQAAGLQNFSSQQFTAQFHELATSVGLPFDEVAYVLEAGESQPYMRYRITLTVKTRYLDVRKFIAALAADMPHVALDSIRCVREAPAAQPLSCEMAFSAFFLKDK